jgi:hypothetical protein
MIAWAFLRFSRDPVLIVEMGCDELEDAVLFEVPNGLSDVPPVACCRSMAATPSASCIVIDAAKLFVLRGLPYFTAQIHGLDELVTSSLPPGHEIQLSHRMFAVMIPLLIPLPFKTDN